MLFVTYDISNDKQRTKFSKFLQKFGRRVQYSVFELKNSHRILQNVMTEVSYKHQPKFSNVDSVLIMNLCAGCKKKMVRYGSPLNEEKPVVHFS